MSFLRKHKKTLIIIGSVAAGLVTVGCISIHLIRQKPIHAVFSSYNVKNNGIERKKLFKKKEGVGNLIVTSHDYGHIDVLVMATELKLSKQNINNAFVAGCVGKTPILTSILKKKNENFKVFYTGKNSNIVTKITNSLNEGNNVVIFLNNNNNGTGIYHTIKNTNCNLILARINPNNYITNTRQLNTDHLFKTLGFCFSTLFKNYHLEYDTFDHPLENETSKEYMSRLKQQLYLEC